METFREWILTAKDPTPTELVNAVLLLVLDYCKEAWVANLLYRIKYVVHVKCIREKLVVRTNNCVIVFDSYGKRMSIYQQRYPWSAFSDYLIGYHHRGIPVSVWGKIFEIRQNQ